VLPVCRISDRVGEFAVFAIPHTRLRRPLG
jgi:hypothetical protein